MSADRDRAPGASEDAKAKFREALERKKQSAHRSAEGRDAENGVHVRTRRIAARGKLLKSCVTN